MTIQSIFTIIFIITVGGLLFFKINQLRSQISAIIMSCLLATLTLVHAFIFLPFGNLHIMVLLFCFVIVLWSISPWGYSTNKTDKSN